MTDAATETIAKEAKKPVKRLTGFDLKMIAVITMLIDHISAGILEKRYIQLIPSDLLNDMENLIPWFQTHGSVAALVIISVIMRCIGRMAFPIYAFLLTEGFKYTGNLRKYGLNLLIFAIISELPFDLAFQETLIYPGYQNVFFTLFIGLVCLFTLSKIEAMKTNLRPALMFLAIFAFAAIAYFLKTDYDAAGVFAISVMYMLRRNKLLAFGLGCGILVLASPIEIFALFMLIPVAYYNGERGRKVNKYLFYGFYPVHLGLIYLVGLLIGILSFTLIQM